MGQPTARVSEGRLPSEIADVLELPLRHALEHSARRAVLRFVCVRETAVDEGAIAAAFSELGAGLIAYHVRVLEQAGAIVAVDGAPPSGPGRNRYESGIADDLQALAALRVTERWDRSPPGSRGSCFSRPLTMFRLPRPGFTVRLGERKASKQ